MNLGIIIASYLGSLGLSVERAMRLLLELADKGYKIDMDVLTECMKKEKEEKREKTTKSQRIIDKAMDFIPGVNLAKVYYDSETNIQSFLNNSRLSTALVPMTEREKILYAKMNGIYQKLFFIGFIDSKDYEDKELLGFIGKRPIIVDSALTTIVFDELLPLNYSLEEVKRLNEVTGRSYRIGKMDGRNVAIIGISNPNSSYKRIKLKADGYKITHNYEKMDEEEAQSQTFRVYPFTLVKDERKEIDDIVEEIRQSRLSNEQGHVLKKDIPKGNKRMK